MENTAAASGPLRMGVVAFLVLRIIVDLCVVRLWGSLQGLLLVTQALHFKPEPLNFHVKILLLFWWARLVMMRQPPVCNRSVLVACSDIHRSDSSLSIAKPCVRMRSCTYC